MVKWICAEDSKYIPTPKGIIGMMSKLGYKLLTRKLGWLKRLPTI